MPWKPKRPCRHPGCGALSDEPYCPAHRQQRERERGSASQRGYYGRWRKERLIFLDKHPLCVLCRQDGTLTTANVVDHIVPHRGDPDLFWNEQNWQALCKPCHDCKTATEDGGFGNASNVTADRRAKILTS